jgi:hypothetical protein
VQVEGNDVVGSSDGEQIGDQSEGKLCAKERNLCSLLCGDGSPRLVFLVLSGIWETRDHSSNSLRRSSLASYLISPSANCKIRELTRDHDEQFHEVIIDRRWTG